MLYIMRHGKTDWNAAYKLQGGVDIPLNEEGRQMAKTAREKYSDLEFDICYCSPLKRARETAEIFLEGRNIPIVMDERLKEMSFGKYEGTERVIENASCPIHVLFKDPLHYVADGGAESLDELFARTGEFIKEVLVPGLQQNHRILIVAHGALNNSIISQYRSIPREDFWSTLQGNCEILRLV